MIKAVREAWNLACAWDHIDPKATEIASFSPANPYAQDYARAAEAYQDYRRDRCV